MLAALRRLLSERSPRPADALNAVRAAFAAMLLAQTGIAAALAIGLRLLLAPGSTAGAGPTLLEPVLLGLGLAQLPLGVVLSLAAARPGGPRSALAAAILAGVLLSVPMWFVALAWAGGSRSGWLLALLAVAALAQLLGFALTGRFARAALERPREPAGDADPTPQQR